MLDLASEKAVTSDRKQAEQMKDDVRALLMMAKASENYFLVYLLGMVLQELDNIGRGDPTPLLS